MSDAIGKEQKIKRKLPIIRNLSDRAHVETKFFLIYSKPWLKTSDDYLYAIYFFFKILIILTIMMMVCYITAITTKTTTIPQSQKVDYN